MNNANNNMNNNLNNAGNNAKSPQTQKNTLVNDRSDTKPVTSRQKVDSALDGAGSQALQKMGVPKGLADKAIKNNGGIFSPTNSPVNNFVKNKARNALAKGLDKVSGNSNPNPNPNSNSNSNNRNNTSNKPSTNFGSKLLSGMAGAARPQAKGSNPDAERIKQLTEIAKKIPIPHVQAAAKVADAANKLGVTDKLTSKNKDGGASSNPFSIAGTFDIKKKMILYGSAFMFLIIIFTGIITSISAAANSNAGSVNEGLCVIESEQEQTCEESSPEAEEFHKRVKEVRREFASSGKMFDPLYMAGFYISVSNAGANISYETMTKPKIEEIANAMFREESTIFDEEYFKENLKNTILPSYIPNESETEYEHIIGEIFDYVSRFEEIYGETNLTGSTFGATLVQIAAAELDESNESKYGGAKYWRYMGFNSRVHWCACFVSWVANTAGVDQSIIPHSASVRTFYEYYTTAGSFHEINSGYIPQPGDLIIWEDELATNAKGWSHIGIVEKYDAATGKLYTIEGNSSDSVARNIYNDLGGCTGFASPAYPVDDSEASNITAGATVTLPSGLGTYATREFDLAYTQSEIDFSRNAMRNAGRITNPYAFPESTNQRKVQDLWISAGGKHDSKGFCKLNGRYLIAVTTTFGVVGDEVDFYLSNGEVIHGIIGDAKSMGDDRANKWGHEGGQVVLEFMGKNSIGDNPYIALGLTGRVTVTKAVNGGTIFNRRKL